MSDDVRRRETGLGDLEDVGGRNAEVDRAIAYRAHIWLRLAGVTGAS